MADYRDILVSTPQDHVRLIRLNRPEKLNALRINLLTEVAEALRAAEADEAVRCVVITGNERAFAAGADINELNAHTIGSIVTDPREANWEAIRGFPKPIIAAVNGFALGGGCELAMMCDFIIAGDDARFGQPEINLGILPGAGGTQRLPRAVGKSLAMKLILTGEFIDAETALKTGLVAEVVAAENALDRALELAGVIATKGPIATRLAKDAVMKAFDTGIISGLEYERRNLHVAFATEDRIEGTAAFLEKRKADFKGR